MYFVLLKTLPNVTIFDMRKKVNEHQKTYNFDNVCETFYLGIIAAIFEQWTCDHEENISMYSFVIFIFRQIENDLNYTLLKS